MPKFTPGPWAVGREGLDIFSRTGDCSIATLDAANSDEEKEANAQLIAEAPELVKELYCALGYIIEAHGIATNPHYKSIAWNDIQRIKALFARIGIDGNEQKGGEA